MILGWTRFKNQKMADYEKIVDYFVAEKVPKLVNGKYISVRRYPAPEVLLGRPARIIRTIENLEQRHRLSAFTLTFTEADISIRDFNAGDSEAREKVHRILDLALAVAFPGVPIEKRPAILVSTHTHTSRLELNFAIPRCVIRPDGSVRAFNPSPPGRRATELWRAFVDTINMNYGFDDPGALERMRLIKLPDAVLKEIAEARRNNQLSRFEPLAAFVQAAEVRAGILLAKPGIPKRDVLLEGLRPLAEQHDLTFETATANGTTFRFRNGETQRSVTIRGPLMTDQFDQLFQRFNSNGRERKIQLAKAPDKLEELWLSVAREMPARHGFEAPEKFYELSEFLEAMPRPRPTVFRRKTHGLRPIVGLLHRLVTQQLMRGLVARLVTALPKNIFAEPRKKLEALNARYAKNHNPESEQGHPGSDRVQQAGGGVDPVSPSPLGHRKRPWGGRATGPDDRGSRRDLAADRESRECDGRRDRIVSKGRAETRCARAGNHRSDGVGSRAPETLELNELDERIKALLARLGVSQRGGDEQIEDALEPAEIVVSEKNDDILPDGP
ncbi:hypothetical protein [Thioclava dalianensis]|uniref:hypothetical protein n=1 Tax=Thioclava dalianensis TaxID=1185766 RepID=UPI001160A9C5|nr:hypothetical protein [Thioclava dalianensis]